MADIGGSVLRPLRWAVLLALPLAACVTTQRAPTATGEAIAAIESRNAAMRELTQQTGTVTGRLARLDRQEKDAVIALLTLSNAVAAYERAGARIDPVPLQTYYNGLRDLSRSYRVPGKFQSTLLACFDASVSCASATKSCLDEGGSEIDCERSPDVVEACGAEAACMYDAFLEIERVFPDILGGRDPLLGPFSF